MNQFQNLPTQEEMNEYLKNIQNLSTSFITSLSESHKKYLVELQSQLKKPSLDVIKLNELFQLSKNYQEEIFNHYWKQTFDLFSLTQSKYNKKN